MYKYRAQVEVALGRKLGKLEHVHHLDGDSTNNEWGNLAVMPRGIHVLLSRVEKHIGRVILFDKKGRPFSPVGIRFVIYRESKGVVDEDGENKCAEEIQKSILEMER